MANTIVGCYCCARLLRPPLNPTQKKNNAAPTAPAADVHVSQDTLTPLKPVTGSFNRCSNPDFPCAVHRPAVGRTPPVTPPGRSASPCSPHVGGSPHGSTSGGSPNAAGKGVAAPASVVDDVMEKFGRPRARSLSRSDRMSLPAWKEEGDEIPPPAPKIEDRRRTVSMSAADLMRDRKPSPEVRRVPTVETRVFSLEQLLLYYCTYCLCRGTVLFVWYHSRTICEILKFSASWCYIQSPSQFIRTPVRRASFALLPVCVQHRLVVMQYPNCMARAKATRGEEAQDGGTTSTYNTTTTIDQIFFNY